MRTLAEVLDTHARTRPDAIALVFRDRQISYAELRAMSNRVANTLLARGISRGSRIAHLGKDSEHFYALLFGAARIGAVLVPINWRLAAAEVEHILHDSGARLLFADHLDGVKLAEFEQWCAAAPEDEVSIAVGTDAPVVQMYTSGTTGLPKGVVLAQRSFFAVRDLLARAELDWIDWRAGDRSLVALPGFHIGGLWWAVQGFTAGITNVIMPAFTSTEAVELIRELGVTTTCMVPSMLRLVANEPGSSTEDFASLRKVVYGGSPISETLLGQCMAAFDCEFAQIYGLTETGNTAVCLPPEDHRLGGPRLRAAGRPYPGVSVRVADRTGNSLPVGEVGEVHLCSPANMLGYWNNPESTEDTLVAGWVRTGDAGYLDGDGYLYIHDRIKDMIIVAGENVYPAEVENVVCRHSAVAEAAVIGVPDDRWGEAVHAFVVLKPEHAVTARELAQFVNGSLAAFKAPLRYEFVDDLPRNPSGKILRRQLRDRFWRGRSRLVN
ncbi:fatty acid--CoA ligase [Kutzneria viridogrisea]|uniref:Long-chain acyl-CoA synthetase n=1 Tax=Kutzneria viridogrisea TaxID=47990 RepID=A0ABR6BHF4_9PSEU|nr:long-chain acyl-CoA synthetase [Kutzneria viridogrisea]